jgi:hypothetical protein
VRLVGRVALSTLLLHLHMYTRCSQINTLAFTNACDNRYDVPMLRDLVVLKPQWVINHVVEIIRDQELHKRTGKAAVSFLTKRRKHVKDLYQRAVLHGTLLEGFWPDLTVDERSQLATLMERYGLIVRIHDDDGGQPVWLVPALLETCKSTVAVPPTATSVFYIFFDIPEEGDDAPKVLCQEDMDTGFLPAGFFHRLLGVATAYMQETVADGTLWRPELAVDCGHLYVVSLIITVSAWL